MSNSEMHKKKRRHRAKLAAKENRIHRNALRNKTIIRPEKKVPEMKVQKGREPWWVRFKRKLGEIPRKIIPSKLRGPK